MTGPAGGGARAAAAPLPVLRIVGAAGVGKTLLIAALTEAMRERGYFVANCAPRGDAATVLTLSTGARVTIERPPDLAALSTLVRSLDPRAVLLLAEGVEATGFPAVEVVRAALDKPRTPPADLLATVTADEVARGFGTTGPSPIVTLVATIEARLLGGESAIAAPSESALARLGRWFGRSGG